MAADLNTVIKQLTESSIIAQGKLENFVPPKADPKTVEELVGALVKSENLTAFQGQQVKAGKAKALILGAYTILDKIGAGGMGQVFKAQHRKLKRLVAIKMLPPSMTKDAVALARFQREVEAAAKLRHPNIVGADDAAEANGVHFLVMEYVDGKDLSATVKKDGPIPVGKAVNYILQAARGLEYAHSEGVVHRDIKPANLLLDKKGVVKILDMGLARLDSAVGAEAGPQAELTGTGTIMGTVDYMSPEQALNTKHADQRADIYSLGMSLYYLLAGRAAYGGDSVMERLLAHREEPIPSLQDTQTTVSTQLEAVFKKMVAKKIEQRYQTMSEVVEALEALGFGGSGTLKKGEIASTFDLSSADKKKLAAKAKRQSLGSISEVVGSEKSKNLLLKIIGGSFGTIIAPILVFYLIRHLDKKDESAPPPAVTAPAVTVTPVVGAANATTQPPVHVVNDGLPEPLVAPFNANVARAGQAAWAKHLGTQVETTNSVGMRLTLIPPGEFLMGSTPEQVAEAKKMGEDDKMLPNDSYYLRLPEEMPQHPVTISQPFLTGSTEVTIAQFRKFVGTSKYVTEAEKYGFGDSGDKAIEKAKGADKGKNWKDPGYPIADETAVTQVTWNDACAYCAWLSEQEQRRPCYQSDGQGSWLIAAHADGYRLPTEAEWEYVCRAGTMTQYSFGDYRSQLEQYGWFNKDKNAVGHAQPVALKLPNPFGLFDLHGNAVEWCQDWYDGNSYKESSRRDPNGPSIGSDRVIRGGDWIGLASRCRSAYRNFRHKPSFRSSYVGFRIVRPLDATTLETAVATAVKPSASPTKPTKPWETSEFQAWVKATQALPAEKQVEAVSEKLIELNPGFDGTTTPKIEKGVVTDLKIVTNAVSEIAPVLALSRLRVLTCIGNGARKGHLSDLSPLKGMQLTQLSCANTQVEDLSPLQGMRIVDLSCGGSNVTDLSPLQDMPTLATLKVRLTRVTPGEVAALQKVLPNCKIEWDGPAKPQASELAVTGRLFMHDPVFQQWVKATQALPAEKQIEAVSRKLMELNPGFDGKLTNIDESGPANIENGAVTELRFRSLQLTDVSPLRAFAKLKVLICYPGGNAGSRLSDLSPLRGAPLAELRCSGTSVFDLSPLDGMPLRIVQCDNTHVSDLSPLVTCNSLISLNVKGTRVTSATVAALQKALPNCRIEWDRPAKATTPEPAAAGKK